MLQQWKYYPPQLNTVEETRLKTIKRQRKTDFFSVDETQLSLKQQSHLTIGVQCSPVPRRTSQ